MASSMMRTVDAQQLLAVDGVRLVEHDADLVVVPNMMTHHNAV